MDEEKILIVQVLHPISHLTVTASPTGEALLFGKLNYNLSLCLSLPLKMQGELSKSVILTEGIFR